VLDLGAWVRDQVLVRKPVRDCTGRAFGGGGLCVGVEVWGASVLTDEAVERN
jgi:hypothetical protein